MKYLNDIKNYKDTLSELLQLDYKLRVDSPNKVNWELSKSKSPDGRVSKEKKGGNLKGGLKSTKKQSIYTQRCIVNTHTHTYTTHARMQ